MATYKRTAVCSNQWWTDHQAYMTSQYGANNYYTTLTLWEAAKQRDLVALDEVERVEIFFNDPNFVTQTACNIKGWTTDATRRVEVISAAGHHHKGNFDGNVLGRLWSYVPFTRFKGLRLHSNTWVVAAIGTTNLIVNECLVSWSSNYYGYYPAGQAKNTVFRCTFTGTQTVPLVYVPSGSPFFRGCTFIGGSRAINSNQFTRVEACAIYSYTNTGTEFAGTNFALKNNMIRNSSTNTNPAEVVQSDLLASDFHDIPAGKFMPSPSSQLITEGTLSINSRDVTHETRT